MDVNSITAEEVLEQANKIFAPYTLKFAAPLSWFAVWKSEFLPQREMIQANGIQSASELPGHSPPKTTASI